MSHELMTIAHVHAYRDELLRDSGKNGRGERREEDQGPSRLRLHAGIILIRLGSWLLRQQVEVSSLAPLADPAHGAPAGQFGLNEMNR